MGIPPSKKSWRHGYGRLKQFVAREGHARVRYDFVTSDGFNLGPWMARQRNSYSEKRLNTEQVRALAVLPGRCWNLITDRWTVKYECLRDYAAREGHTTVPARYKTAEGVELGNWVVIQRWEYRRKNLPAERIMALEALPGWCWEPTDARREEIYYRIKEYAVREGHSRVPKRYVTPDGFNLGRKVKDLRRYRNRNMLKAEFVRRLAALPGWTWDEINTQRQRGYEALLSYVAKKGHARVPSAYRAPNGFCLGGLGG